MTEQHKAFVVGMNDYLNGVDLISGCPFDDGERGMAWWLGYCFAQNGDLALVIEQQTERVLQKAWAAYNRLVGPQAA